MEPSKEMWEGKVYMSSVKEAVLGAGGGGSCLTEIFLMPGSNSGCCGEPLSRGTVSLFGWLMWSTGHTS